MPEQNRPNRNAPLLRAAALLYALYLAFTVAERYVTGAPDALSLPATVIAVSVMVLGAGALLVLTWKDWRKKRASSGKDRERKE